MAHEYNNLCVKCGSHVLQARWKLGYNTCLQCGEIAAKQVKHTVVPMPKSNYIPITNMELLIGLNSSHKGGVK
jgi:ribosomal protein L37AE/L43A